MCSRQNEKETNGGSMRNWRVRSVVIPSKALAISTSNKTSFESGKHAIVIPFDFEDPFAGDRPGSTRQFSNEDETVHGTIAE